jgi:PAS domain S-box-containing protein
MPALRVLLIEDNPGDALLVKTALAEQAPGEFTITCVERLADALAQLAAEPFDVVLSDLGLPDSNRLDTVQAVVDHAAALPLVVLTGSHDAHVGHEAIRLGAQDYLIKGESGGALIERTLRYAIERKRMAVALRAANETLEQRVAESTAVLQKELAERKLAEERLKTRNNLLKALINSSGNIAIFSLDRDYRYTTFNERHRQEMRTIWQAEIRVGASLLETMTDSALRLWARHSIDRALGGESFTEIQHQSGANVDYELSWNPVRLTDGKVAGVTAFIRDVTERMAMQATANESRRALLSILEDQARDQAKLRDSEAFANHILDSVIAEIAVLDGNGVITAVNRPWREFALENGIVPGQSAAHTGIGENYLALCRTSAGPGSDEAASAREGIIAVLEGRLPVFRLEYPCHSTQQQRWFSMSVTPLETAGGGVVVAHTEITERRKAETSLRDSEIRYRTTTATAKDAIVTINSAGKVEGWNPAAANMFGYAEGEIVGKSLALIVPPRFQGRHEAGMQQRLADGAPPLGGKTIEVVGLRRDGGEFPMELSLAQWDSGQDRFFTGFMRDISERKAAEAALSASEQRFRGFIENASDIIFELATDGTITYLSPNWTAFTGQPVSDAIGKSIESYLHPDDVGRCRKMLQEAAVTAEVVIVEYRVSYLDGAVRWHSTTGKAVRDGNGNMTGYLGIARDITERKAVEAELHKLSLAVEQSPESIVITDADGAHRVCERRLPPGHRLPPRGGDRPQPADAAVGQDAARDLRSAVGSNDSRPPVEGRVLQQAQGRQRIHRIRHRHAAAPAGRHRQPLCRGEGRHHRQEAHRHRAGFLPVSPGGTGREPHRGDWSPHGNRPTPPTRPRAASWPT